jgi:hypothetical protein
VRGEPVFVNAYFREKDDFERFLEKSEVETWLVCMRLIEIAASILHVMQILSRACGRAWIAAYKRDVARCLRNVNS